MSCTPKVDNVDDSKRIRFYAITEKVELSFAEEFNHLLDLCDKTVIKGDKKYLKLETKSNLEHKYYWVHKEEDTFSTV